jgi:hypothetical protein
MGVWTTITAVAAGSRVLPTGLRAFFAHELETAKAKFTDPTTAVDGTLDGMQASGNWLNWVRPSAKRPRASRPGCSCLQPGIRRPRHRHHTRADPRRCGVGAATCSSRLYQNGGVCSLSRCLSRGGFRVRFMPLRPCRARHSPFLLLQRALHADRVVAARMDREAAQTSISAGGTRPPCKAPIGVARALHLKFPRAPAVSAICVGHAASSQFQAAAPAACWPAGRRAMNQAA